MHARSGHTHAARNHLHARHAAVGCRAPTLPRHRHATVAAQARARRRRATGTPRCTARTPTWWRCWRGAARARRPLRRWRRCTARSTAWPPRHASDWWPPVIDCMHLLRQDSIRMRMIGPQPRCITCALGVVRPATKILQVLTRCRQPSIL